AHLAVHRRMDAAVAVASIHWGPNWNWSVPCYMALRPPTHRRGRRRCDPLALVPPCEEHGGVSRSPHPLRRRRLEVSAATARARAGTGSPTVTVLLCRLALDPYARDDR